MLVKTSLLLHQIELSRCDYESAQKNKDIEFNRNISAPSVEKWWAFENGGVGGVLKEIL